MYRISNTLIGYLNLLSLLASIPIIGGALWFARSSATCDSTLQTPLLILGFVILLVSLAGFVGGCFNVACALWFYLFVMLLLIAALLCVTVFGFAVTGGGGGTQVAGRVYKEYKLEDYSGWLRKRISCWLGTGIGPSTHQGSSRRERENPAIRRERDFGLL